MCILLIVFVSIPMTALHNAGAAIYRAMGNSSVAVKNSLLMNAINLGGNALLIFGFHMGVFGVWVAMTIDWLFRAICFAIRYLRGKWKHAALV